MSEALLDFDNLKELNYEPVYEILKKKRNESTKWLKDAIEK